MILSQACGEDSNPSYTSNVANVCNETNSLIATRKSIYDLLKGTALYALRLAPTKYACEASIAKSEATSIFYHIGTMPEFIDNFSNDKTFRKIFGVQPLTSCLGLPYLFNNKSSVKRNKSSLETGIDGSLACKIVVVTYNTPSIMRSTLAPLVCVGDGSIIEYSIIGANSVIGKGSIVSGCHLPGGSTIPDQSFFHTIPILVDGVACYMTVAFQTDANMKKQINALDNVYHFGRPLKSYNICDNSDPVNLWNAKIFPVAATMEQSYKLVSVLDYISEMSNAYCLIGTCFQDEAVHG